MDYILFCRKYYEATGIPVTFAENGKVLYNTVCGILNITPTKRFFIPPLSRNPELVRRTPDLEYGAVEIEGTQKIIIIGPHFSIPLNDKILDELLCEGGVSNDLRDQVEDILSTVPLCTSAMFMRHLSLICLCVNGRAPSIEEHFLDPPLQANAQKIRQQESQRLEDIKSVSVSYKDTYAFEKVFYGLVASGNVTALKQFMKENVRKVKNNGCFAVTPLRNIKNRFMVNAGKLMYLSAIPAGLSVDEAYELVGLYAVECESKHTIEDVTVLEYSMTIDFCQRIARIALPVDVSREVRESIMYIRTYTSMALTPDDVASYIGRSSSYISKRFKDELGVTIGQVVRQCRLEEAKSLLATTDMPLVDISTLLNFSTQSYFQNVFKKKYGVTPTEYRRKNSVLPHT